MAEYVKNALLKGYSVEGVVKALKNEGWSDAEINEAVASAQTAPQPAPQSAAEPAGKMGIGGKFIGAIKSPGQMFEAVKQEHDLNSAVKYYTLLSLIPFLIALATILMYPTFMGSATPILSLFGPMSVLFLIFMALGAVYVVLLYFMAIVYSFSFAGLFHLFAMILKAEKNGFAQTYKSFAYALPIGLIGSIVFIAMLLTIPAQPIAIFVVSLAFGVWYLVVSVIGLSHLHEISKGRAAFVVIVPMAIILVIFLVVYFYLIPLMITQMLGSMGGLGGIGV